MEAEQKKYAALSAKWQARFEFYDQHGAPGTKEFKSAIKDFPVGKKILLSGNLIAFFFGPIYLFVLGLWKKNLSVIGIMLLVGIILRLFEWFSGIMLPGAMDLGIGAGFCIVYMQVANYGYYLKVTQNSQSWNPFEGLKMF